MNDAEKELLRLIAEHPDPEKALLTALKVIGDFLKNDKSKEIKRQK